MIKCVCRGMEFGSDIKNFSVTYLKPQFYRKFILEKKVSLCTKKKKKTYLLIFIKQFPPSKTYCYMVDRLYKWIFLLNKYQRKPRYLYSQGVCAALLSAVRFCQLLIQPRWWRAWLAGRGLWPQSFNRTMCHWLKQKKKMHFRRETYT